MTLRIKANRSSAFRGQMGCRYCDEDVRIENQEHLEKCDGFKYEQRGLNLDEEIGKQIFWRRMAPKLKKIYDQDKENNARLSATKVTKATRNKKVIG